MGHSFMGAIYNICFNSIYLLQTEKKLIRVVFVYCSMFFIENETPNIYGYFKRPHKSIRIRYCLHTLFFEVGFNNIKLFQIEQINRINLIILMLCQGIFILNTAHRYKTISQFKVNLA